MAATHTTLFIWLMFTCLHITMCGWPRMDVPASQCCMYVTTKVVSSNFTILKKSCYFCVHWCVSGGHRTSVWAQLSPPLVLCHWRACVIGWQAPYPLSYLIGIVQFFSPLNNFLCTFKVFFTSFSTNCLFISFIFNWLDRCWFLDYTFKNGQLITNELQVCWPILSLFEISVYSTLNVVKEPHF